MPHNQSRGRVHAFLEKEARRAQKRRTANQEEPLAHISFVPTDVDEAGLTLLTVRLDRDHELT
jgi:hypothetical protein